jgi:hypothetical protein
MIFLVIFVGFFERETRGGGGGVKKGEKKKIGGFF